MGAFYLLFVLHAEWLPSRGVLVHISAVSTDATVNPPAHRWISVHAVGPHGLLPSTQWPDRGTRKANAEAAAADGAAIREAERRAAAAEKASAAKRLAVHGGWRDRQAARHGQERAAVPPIACDPSVRFSTAAAVAAAKPARQSVGGHRCSKSARVTAGATPDLRGVCAPRRASSATSAAPMDTLTHQSPQVNGPLDSDRSASISSAPLEAHRGADRSASIYAAPLEAHRGAPRRSSGTVRADESIAASLAAPHVNGVWPVTGLEPASPGRDPLAPLPPHGAPADTFAGASGPAISLQEQFEMALDAMSTKLERPHDVDLQAGRGADSARTPGRPPSPPPSPTAANSDEWSDDEDIGSAGGARCGDGGSRRRSGFKDFAKQRQVDLAKLRIRPAAESAGAQGADDDDEEEDMRSSAAIAAAIAAATAPSQDIAEDLAPPVDGLCPAASPAAGTPSPSGQRRRPRARPSAPMGTATWRPGVPISYSASRESAGARFRVANPRVRQGPVDLPETDRWWGGGLCGSGSYRDAFPPERALWSYDETRAAGDPDVGVTARLQHHLLRFPHYHQHAAREDCYVLVRYTISPFGVRRRPKPANPARELPAPPLIGAHDEDARQQVLATMMLAAAGFAEMPKRMPKPIERDHETLLAPARKDGLDGADEEGEAVNDEAVPSQKEASDEAQRSLKNLLAMAWQAGRVDADSEYVTDDTPVKPKQAPLRRGPQPITPVVQAAALMDDELAEHSEAKDEVGEADSDRSAVSRRRALKPLVYTDAVLAAVDEVSRIYANMGLEHGALAYDPTQPHAYYGTRAGVEVHDPNWLRVGTDDPHELREKAAVKISAQLVGWSTRRHMAPPDDLHRSHSGIAETALAEPRAHLRTHGAQIAKPEPAASLTDADFAV